MDPINVGADAPGFMLPDTNGIIHSCDELRGKIVLLDFWSAECEWCERVDAELITFIPQWGEAVVSLWIASNPNEPGELIGRVAAERKLPTVLVDGSQQVADLYGAQTTPHFFIIDGNGKLAYQGAWDDITFRQRVATKKYVPAVVESLRKGQQPTLTQTPAYGCVLVRLNATDY